MKQMKSQMMKICSLILVFTMLIAIFSASNTNVNAATPEIRSALVNKRDTGRIEIYHVLDGSPATFTAADAKTGEIIFQSELPGDVTNVYDLTKGSDDNIYFGSSKNSLLLRYLPEEERVEIVGNSSSSDFIFSVQGTESGKVFGSTYGIENNSEVFIYDILNEEFTNLGTVRQGERWARALATDNDRLFVGTGSSGHLYSMDLDNPGIFQEIIGPFTGKGSPVALLQVIGDVLFVKADQFYALDLNTYEYLGSFRSTSKYISGPSPHDENLVYSARWTSSGTQLQAFNLETHELELLEGTPLPAGGIQTLDWITLDSGQDVLIGVTHLADLFHADPVTGLGFKPGEDPPEKLELIIGESENLGEVVPLPKTSGGAIGQNNNGEWEVYFQTDGYPGAFNVYDALTGQLKFSEILPASYQVNWRMSQGSDGNVYFGDGSTGDLSRYIPEEMRIESVGKNPAGTSHWDLDATEDGRIFGSTYPTSGIYMYDTEAGTFTDLGRLHDTEDYARGSGIVGDYLYSGTGARSYLYRMPLERPGEFEQIETPFDGAQGMVTNVESYGERIFVKHSTGTFVLDKESHEHIKTFGSWTMKMSGPSPYDPSLVYFGNSGELFTYNLTTDEIELVEGVQTPPGAMQSLTWVPREDDHIVLVGFTSETDVFHFDPVDNSVTLLDTNPATQGTRIQSMEAGHDNLLYLGGYGSGATILDMVDDSILHTSHRIKQVEGFGFMNDKVYFGTYGEAIILEYDPALPFNPGSTNVAGAIPTDNPIAQFKIPGQDRPFAFTSGENKLFIGTIPDYGVNGGALTIFDAQEDTWTVHTNVVQDQSIVGLAYSDGLLYGSTSIWGGYGIEPVEDTAKIFVWDVAAGEKIAEFTPELPGRQGPPEIIGELSIGPDNLLWGASRGTIFAIDPDTYEVVKSKRLSGDGLGSRVFIPQRLRWGGNGLLYTNVGNNLTIFNPVTLDHEIVATGVRNIAIGLGDDVYYTQESELHKVTVRKAQAEPEVPISFAGQMSIHVDKESVLKEDGELLTVTVSGHELDQVNAYDLVVDYDQTILEVDGIRAVDPEQVLFVDASKSTLGAARVIMTGLPLSGDAELFELTFKVIGSGTAEVSITKADVARTIDGTSEEAASKILGDPISILVQKLDLNGDGQISLADLSKLAVYYRVIVDANPEVRLFDFNQDGIIDSMDLAILASAIE